MIIVRQGVIEERDKVMDFYGEVIDFIKDSSIGPGWVKDVYPSCQMVEDSLKKQELYIAETKGQAAGALVLNREFNKGYADVPWGVQAEPGQVAIIHAFAVSPRYWGQGVGKKMLEQICKERKRQGDKTIRLDVLTRNLPAARLYKAMGFQLAGTANLYYEPIGRQEFWFYEYKL